MTTAIVKPTHDCNLSCSYCYVSPNAERGRMSYKTLVNCMEQVATQSQENAHFIWHGGEPLLMGVDFFKEVAEISDSLRKRDSHVSNGIQSNATLVTEELLDFIEQEDDFHLGFSLDGPKEINNRTRKYPDGRGSFDNIWRGITMVRERQKKSKKNMGGGVISVLNKKNFRDIIEIYRFLNQEGINVKINPIIDSGDVEYGISPKEYAQSMNRLFDVWVQNYHGVDVDTFTRIMGNLMTGVPLGCNYSANCRRDFVSVGPQGDIYPCGRFDGVREFHMGNVNEKGLTNALTSDINTKIKQRSLETVKGCSKCNYGKVCNGGCMHNAHIGGDVMEKDSYCLAYKQMFRHIERFLHQELSKAEMSGGNLNEN